MPGNLYIVPTPIGNLEDITLRALRILKEVDLIAAEDTRTIQKILNHYQIHNHTTSYYEANRETKGRQLIQQLQEGKNIALVSESGTPGVSDPGCHLIKSAIDARIPVIPLPGPSAVITALIASGLPANSFVFLGFLPRKPGKIIKELKQAGQLETTVIFFESPHRIIKTLELIRINLGEINIVVCRELTKKFEEILRGTPTSILAHLQKNPPRGEMAVLFEPRA